MGELAPERNTGFKKWWSMLRPHTLSASFVPVALGTALVLPVKTPDLAMFVAMLVASMLIQIATNLFNEYFDYKRGLDSEESVGIGGSIVRDGFHPKTILRLAFTLCGVAMLIGIFICANSSWWIALAGSLCILTGYLYSGGPYPIAYTPFGELISGLFMGVFIIWISFFIQTETLTLNCVLISIPIGILVGGINMANNIRDLSGDQQKGRRTLPILLGRPRAITLLAGLFTFSYIWIFGLMILGVESAWMLLVFASLPKAIQATKLFRRKTKAIQMMPAMKATAQLQTLFGILLSLGLVLDYFI
ncbi:1,4-dihydroxy-2-naphthoate polyprenyltransferase [Sporolactobacillus shoreicorticis]|uniref:1,4-dihydroxy-2-naphthoate octaprenyltransferase n=1 Tax=Sporolactobacillus shoreicorticis TaxID=1923877 RepID=A0ABW5S5N1_9BACL|nr:1,4-dihydroxy-2-naphthoate polyprenyltransferase [Sporolactobacillus shoreicorticis]MCO7126718.1 1,4-dihydroxy-2-naphthoate polyprenyltransferase [Sporolactobacillus shoreicorticis]